MNSLFQPPSIKNGFVAVMLVIVIGAAALAFGLSGFGLGLTRLALVPVNERGLIAARAADGCLEIALLELRRDDNYAVAAPANVSIGVASCIIEVMITDPATRAVLVTASFDGAARRLTAAATVGPRSVELTAWRRGN